MREAWAVPQLLLPLEEVVVSARQGSRSQREKSGTGVQDWGCLGLYGKLAVGQNSSGVGVSEYFGVVEPLG
jgi:hypothetical protein